MFLKKIFQRTIDYTRRQTPDFKLMLGRRALHGVSSGLSTQYNSIYATLLGADPVQLGSLQSVGNVIGALVSLPAGWFIDYYSLKKVFLLSSILLAASPLFYLLANHWTWLYVGIILYYLGIRLACNCCTVVCAAELENKERATGRGLCRTFSSVVAIITPIVGAWIVFRFGGISLSGLRPIYAIQVVILAIMFLLLLTRLSNSYSGDSSKIPKTGVRHMLTDSWEVFGNGHDVVRLMLVIGLMELPWTISTPFMPVFAHEFKGANEFILGGIATASAIVPMVASLPLGRLADRFGRKKILFIIAPTAYIANLCLIFAPASGLGGQTVLLIYGVLFGFNSIGMALASSMAAEIVPKEQLGRWIGIIGLFRGLLSIPAPIIGGLIWEHIGPQYIFFAAIAIDLFFRLPLLAMVRETLQFDADKLGPKLNID